MATKKSVKKKSTAKKASKKSAANKKSVKKKSTAKKASEKPARKQSVTIGSSEVRKSEKGISPLVYLVLGLVIIAAVLMGGKYLPEYRQQQVEQEYMYNNFVFEPTDDGLWAAHLQANDRPYKILFHYHPTELERIPVQDGLNETIKVFSTRARQGDDVQSYITVNPDETAGVVLAGVELAKVFGEKFDLYGIPIRSAVTKRGGVGDDVPVITCLDADKDTLVFWIKTKGDSLVAAPEGMPTCVVLQGQDANETIMVADRLVYEVLGIMTE